MKNTIRYYSGHIYRGENEGYRPGTIGIENGYVVEDIRERGFGTIDGIENEKKTVVSPLFFNAHTHLGDSFITEPVRGGLGEMVIPPDGLKHRKLSEAADAVIANAMVGEMGFMASTGTGFFCDYREGGSKGLKARELADELVKEGKLSVPERLVLGRPEAKRFDEEMDDILNNSDGFGLNSLEDYALEDIIEASMEARRRKKLFSAHVSEGRRENLEVALRCGAWPMIHLSCATEKDLHAITEARLPIVVCPRSNLMFSLMPNICKMISVGVEFMVGTDNSFITRPDMHAELDVLMRVFMHMNPGDVDGVNAIYRASLGIPLLEHGKENLEGKKREKFEAGFKIAKNGFREGERAVYQAVRNTSGAGDGEIEYWMINRASAMDIIRVEMW